MCVRVWLTITLAAVTVALSISNVNAQRAAAVPERAAAVPVSAASANKARGTNYNVDVQSVIAKNTSQNKVVYAIRYTYEFKGRNAVYVNGIGTVPAKGKFSYLTSVQHLEFRESATGTAIVTVPLEETTITMGSDSTDLPKEGDFPQAFRSDNWTPSATFPEAALKVIQKYFPSGYAAHQNGQTNYYVTTYRNLQVTNRQLRSQIAVAISQPYDISGDKFAYHIQFIARDHPRLSNDWRYGDDRDQETLTAAEGFINQLISELDTSGGRRQ
jgi:hypothetical protein